MNMLSHRTTYFWGSLIAFALLGMTFYLQKFDGFIPCPLCILQRVTLGTLCVIFLLGWIFSQRKWLMLVIDLLANLVSIIGILLSGRQVWLQHLPASDNADCGVSLQYLIHALPFDQIIAKIIQGTAECSQKSWEFLNLSLAEWSLICFIFFFLFCLLQTKRTVKHFY
jgi:disulfide bond formation protein DsbB